MLQLFIGEQSLTLEEAQVLVLKVLKQVMEEKLDSNNVQLCQVIPNVKRGYKILSEEELKAAIERLQPSETDLALQQGTGDQPAASS